jgi:hypothetical protein
VKTLLAGPSPISPMKAEITISPISNTSKSCDDSQKPRKGQQKAKNDEVKRPAEYSTLYPMMQFTCTQTTRSMR